MDEVIVWLIIAAFYAPLHYGGPVGVAILTTPAVALRRRLVRYILIECSLTMVLAFTLVIWQAGDNLDIAMLILLLSMVLPYLSLWIHRLMSADKLSD
jgi:hypothetical protein